MSLHAKETLLSLTTIMAIAVLAPGAAAVTIQNNTNQNEHLLSPAALLLRVRRNVGCSDSPSSDGNLCYNAQCRYFSMGACKDGFCACAPEGTNMAAIRVVCYDSCYASCTGSCLMNNFNRTSLKTPCDTSCTKLCYEN
ncbi:hypothetical protein MRX96_032593 [Rhipicephalus microplus]